MRKIGGQQVETIELSYENIEIFMDQYFKAYTEYVNDPETIDKLDIYYTADFTSLAYMNTPGTGEYPFVIENRAMWKDFLAKGHQNTKETLSALELNIDERKGKVTAILEVRKENRTTGEKSQIMGIAIYGIVLESNTMKFKSLTICIDNPQRIAQTWKQAGTWNQE